MLGWIVQTSLISIIIIILLHYLFIFFKTNLTSPQTKDLVYKPQEQYKEIFECLNNKSINQNISKNTGKNLDKDINQDKMKQELKDFLKDLNKKSKDPLLLDKSPSDINSFSNSYSNSYSLY